MEPGDGNTQDVTAWPLSKFRFEVDFGDGAGTISFQEVSGLDVETQTIEYRKGNNARFSTIKMPGLKKYSSITLKKGVFKEDNKFWDWYNEIKMNTLTRRTIIIKLLNEEGKATMVWQLTNAWPAKISGTDLNSSGNEVAVESIELSHEGLTISNA
jgi:phage tail-like protein